MAVTMAEITKLRHLTSAGLMDCKKALAETDGDIEKAVEILRKKGQAVAAKREDRQAAEGCVLAKSEGNFAAIVAQKILDAAVANRVKSVDELKALQLNGLTIADLVTEESGKTGEKTEISAYEWLEGPSTTSYNHLGNKLSTIVAFNLEGVDYQVGRDVAMQVASMNPVAVDQASVPAEVVESEKAVAIEKTKQEQVKKAVENALKKAGINPNLVDSEDHIESNIAKGWLTAEEADKARVIIKETAEAKAANLPEQMIENITKGRLQKFYKESCLMEQEFIKDGDLTIGKYLEKAQSGLVVAAFKRVNLNQD